LHKLSNDKDENIRAAVAKNPDTPQDILEKLSKDEHEDVRKIVSEHPTRS